MWKRIERKETDRRRYWLNADHCWTATDERWQDFGLAACGVSESFSCRLRAIGSPFSFSRATAMFESGARALSSCSSLKCVM